MAGRTASRVAWLLGALAAMPACNPLAPKACTVVGCGASFIVEITSATGQPSVTVTATASDGSSTTGTCLWANGVCTALLGLQADFTPPTAIVRLEWESRTAEFTVNPTYVTSYPNGQSCPPTCKSTRVPLTLPPT